MHLHEKSHAYMTTLGILAILPSIDHPCSTTLATFPLSSGFSVFYYPAFSNSPFLGKSPSLISVSLILYFSRDV